MWSLWHSFPCVSRVPNMWTLFSHFCVCILSQLIKTNPICILKQISTITPFTEPGFAILCHAYGWAAGKVYSSHSVFHCKAFPDHPKAEPCLFVPPLYIVCSSSLNSCYSTTTLLFAFKFISPVLQGCAVSYQRDLGHTSVYHEHLAQYLVNAHWILH
jgi:hypothetical protein